jgi:hypothetical protein
MPTQIWPDATNTGVPDGVKLTPSGGLTITKSGTVIDALEVNGPIHIQADNVTIKNSSITSSDYAVIRIDKGVTGTVIQDCDINGQNAGGQGIEGQGTFLRNDISGVADGMNIYGPNTTIQDNYIHDLGGDSGSHYDGIQVDGGASNLKIAHNTIINDHGQTSAIMIDDEFGANNHVTVDNNIMVGGGYTIYVTGDHGNGTTDVSVTNNHMGEGYYGYMSIVSANPTMSGNVHDGDALVATLGQQPAVPDTGSSTDDPIVGGDPAGDATVGGTGPGGDSSHQPSTGGSDGSQASGSDGGSTSGSDGSSASGSDGSSGSDTGSSASSGDSGSSSGSRDTGSSDSSDSASTSDGHHHHWNWDGDSFHFHTGGRWGSGWNAPTQTSSTAQSSDAAPAATTDVASADDGSHNWHSHTEWNHHHSWHGHDFFM